MNSGSGSKRKESSGHRAFTGNGSRKRAKTTAGSTNAHRSAGRDGGNGDSDTAPARPAHALSNLRDTYKQEQQEYQRSIDELNDKLEASEQKVEQYRSKYKHGLSDMVEKKTAAAEQRVSDAEHKIKQIKQKHKEDIIGIRKELVEAAKDGMGQAAQNTTSSPERAYDTAETALKKLKKMDPELYYELVTSQHCYEKIAAKLEEARVTIDRAPTGLQLAQSPDEATSECARALKTLETDLVDAAEDMRSNSTLSNQKKTLRKKMMAALKEVEPVFMAHAEAPQGKHTNNNIPVLQPHTISPASTVDGELVLRKNQQLEAMIRDLQFKLRDVRGKLEEEVAMRQKADNGSKEK